MTFDFRVRDLRVDRAFLGTAHGFMRDDMKVTVEFPLRGGDLVAPGKLWFFDRGSESESWTPPDLDPELEIHYLRVGVELHTSVAVPLPLPSSARSVDDSSSGLIDEEFEWAKEFLKEIEFEDIDDLEGEHDMAWQPALEEALSRAGPVARAVVEQVVEWCRVTRGQFWLGMHGETPPLAASPRLWAWYAPRGEWIFGRKGPGFRVRRRRLPTDRYEHRALDIQDVRDIVERVGLEKAPRFSDSLLADARYLAGFSEPPDYSRALLAAAIACEVKVKEALREKAGQSSRPLIDIIVKKYRPVRDIFHVPLDAALGHSLRREDKDLFNRIGNLFDLRNNLVHQGIRPAPGDVEDAISAAVKVFSWLDSLPPTAS